MNVIGTTISGRIPIERMTFDSNTVFKKEGNEVGGIQRNFVNVIYYLADVNCRLWDEQEKAMNLKKCLSMKRIKL
jgi:hypothetical protein